MKSASDPFIRFSYLGHSINEMYWFILPLVLPKILKEYGISYLKAGGLLTVYLLIVSLFSFLIGKASDSLPRWKILTTGFFLTFGGFFMAGTAPGMIPLTLFLCAGAVGVSAFHPIAYALLDEHTSNRKGSVFGNFECWGMAGVFIMFALNGILLTLLSWRSVLLITAFPSLLMGLLAVTTKAPDSKGRTGQKDSALPESSPSLLLLSLFFVSVVLRIISILGILNFMPTYLMKGLGVEEHLAAFSAGIYFLGAIIGARIGGKRGDAVGHIRVLLTATLVMAPVIYLLGILKVWWTAPVLLLILGISSSSVAPNQNYILSRLSAGMGRGATFGTLVGILTMTNALSPLLFGAGADIFGLARTIRFFSVPMAFSFLVFALIGGTNKFKKALDTGS